MCVLKIFILTSVCICCFIFALNDNNYPGCQNAHISKTIAEGKTLLAEVKNKHRELLEGLGGKITLQPCLNGLERAFEESLHKHHGQAIQVIEEIETIFNERSYSAEWYQNINVKMKKHIESLNKMENDLKKLYEEGKAPLK